MGGVPAAALGAEENQELGGQNWPQLANVVLVSVTRETLRGITRRFC